MIYLFIALCASLIGAISGLGGGVIIKPMMDLVSDLSVSTISILSAFTVLAMSVASLSRQIYYKTKIEVKLGIMLSAGAFLGGYAGNYLFSRAVRSFVHPGVVPFLQNVILTVLLVGVLVYMNKFRGGRTFHLTNSLFIVVAGFCLGTISSFLGIGGGPINIVALTLLFSMDTKSAAVNSILLIFFSQASKLLTVGLTQGFAAHDLSLLWLMIPAGIIGGLVGASLNKKLPSNRIITVFNATMVFIIVVGVVNVIKALSTFI